MLFVVKMNTNASTDGISSKIELLKRLEGLEKFQHKIGVQESFQFRINDGNSKEEFKEAGEGGEVERKDEEKKTTEFEDPFVKKDNNSDVEALLEYCPEGGEKLGNLYIFMKVVYKEQWPYQADKRSGLKPILENISIFRYSDSCNFGQYPYACSSSSRLTVYLQPHHVNILAQYDTCRPLSNDIDLEVIMKMRNMYHIGLN